MTRCPPRQASLARWLSPLALLLAALGGAAQAHLGPVPPSLSGVATPEVPGLMDGDDPIVVDVGKAIILGKALFWDTSVGSDGVACATCHFHAGADSRTKHQVVPAGHAGALSSASFEGTDGRTRGYNYTLKRSDFPFNQSVSPLLETVMARTSDDVTGSAGTFSGTYLGQPGKGSSIDDCSRAVDPVFHAGSVGTRRITQRNAPSVINAVFNHRQFWDGRANNVFNGSSGWGDRDPDAGVWVKNSDGSVTRQRLRLVNSSLASQALAPALNPVEMSCEGRVHADLGRKLLTRRALANQEVHWNDSALGYYAQSKPGNLKKGLNTDYYSLVRQAFNKKYWSATSRGPFGAPKPVNGAPAPQPYSQAEANFGMFFALALQIYETSLVSYESPFDLSERDEAGTPIDLSESQIRGMNHFEDAHCNLCHLGPVFTAAALETNAALVAENPLAFGSETFTVSTTRNVVTRMAGTKGTGIIDTGFAATSVAMDEWDPGLAAMDDYGNPLSFAVQYLQFLAGNTGAVVDSAVTEVRPCDLQTPIALNQSRSNPVIFTQTDGIQPQVQDSEGCFNPLAAFVPTPAVAAAELANPATKKMLHVVDSAFKIPSLRNVELTGPYMHNGSMASLEEVIEFYTRGGNFEGASKQFGFVFPQSQLQFDAQARTDVLNFLKSLTDDRVRHERAPFDHPAIKVTHGHAGDQDLVQGGNSLGTDLGLDEYLDIPAVGAEGVEAPLAAFADTLDP